MPLPSGGVGDHRSPWGVLFADCCLYAAHLTGGQSQTGQTHHCHHHCHCCLAQGMACWEHVVWVRFLGMFAMGCPICEPPCLAFPFAQLLADLPTFPFVPLVTAREDQAHLPIQLAQVPEVPEHFDILVVEMRRVFQCDALWALLCRSIGVWIVGYIPPTHSCLGIFTVAPCINLK